LLAVTFATHASAADLPLKAAMDPAPVYSWAGFYIGGSLGAGLALQKVLDLSGSIYDVGAAGYNQNLGAIVGANLGYNFQSGNLVYGVEADISYNTAKSILALYNTTPDNYIRLTSNILSTVRGRFGYSFDRALVL